MQIRIVARPFGDAPEYIRDAWIGLLLPVHPNYPHTVESRHVSLMRPITPLVMWVYRFIAPRARGYIVATNAAMNILESAKPTAAEWFRTNTPHLFESEGGLLFDEACCAVEDSALPGVGSK